MKIVVLVVTNTVVDELTSVLSCCRSYPGLVVVLLFQKVGDVTRDYVVGFFVDCAQAGFHTSYAELLPSKFGYHFTNTGGSGFRPRQIFHKR